MPPKRRPKALEETRSDAVPTGAVDDVGETAPARVESKGEVVIAGTPKEGSVVKVGTLEGPWQDYIITGIRPDGTHMLRPAPPGQADTGHKIKMSRGEEAGQSSAGQAEQVNTQMAEENEKLTEEKARLAMLSSQQEDEIDYLKGQVEELTKKRTKSKTKSPSLAPAKEDVELVVEILKKHERAGRLKGELPLPSKIREVLAENDNNVVPTATALLLAMKGGGYKNKKRKSKRKKRKSSKRRKSRRRKKSKRKSKRKRK